VTFLILNVDYPEFLQWHYGRHPGLGEKSYDEQLTLRDHSLFGDPYACASNLRKLGHEAFDIHANNEFMQKTWAREHGLTVADSQWKFRLRRGMVPWVSRIPRAWFYAVLAAQIKYYKPDVLLNQAVDNISGAFLREVKSHVRLVVGQHAASPLSAAEDLKAYDLMISSFPPTVEYFRTKGIPAELSRLGFEPRVLSSVAGDTGTFDVTFIGSFSRIHSTRIDWLERLCLKLPQLRVWAPGIDHLPPDSPIRRHYAGAAWGRDMYNVLHASKITLNHHGDIAPYANNSRLYEATGVGTLLVTDWKENLHEMFDPGREVVTYRSPEECAERVEYYLGHAGEREAIARAGQQRTLRDHTYYQRMQELVDIVQMRL
jgi:spore maturation protein CgeB